MSVRTRFWLAILLLVAVQGGLYGVSVWRGEFVNYDDPTAIVDNEKIAELSFDNVRDLFNSPTFNAYVPFYFLSLAVDRALFDLNPLFFHLGNVLLSIFNAAAVMLLAWWVSGRFGWALFAAVIFSLMPAHAESVVWASGRKDVLSMAFLWFAIFAGIRACRADRVDWRFGAATLVALALALLTKGTTIVYPGLAAITLWWLGKRSRDWRILAICAAGVTAAALFIHIYFAQQQGAGRFGIGGQVVERFTAAAFILARNLVAPFWLSASYPSTMIVGGTELAARWGLLIALGVLLIWIARRSPLAAVGALWALVALLPFNSVFPETDLLAADRYLYIPSIGMALVLAGACAWLMKRHLVAARATAVVLGLYVTAGFAWSAHERTQVWSSTETLWRDTLEKQPSSYVARMNLALHLRDSSQDLCGVSTHQRSSTLEEASRLLAGAPVPEKDHRRRYQLERTRAELAMQRGQIATGRASLEKARRALGQIEVRGDESLEELSAQLDVIDGHLSLVEGKLEDAELAFEKASTSEAVAPIAKHNLAVLHFNQAVLALQAGASVDSETVRDELSKARALYAWEAAEKPDELAPLLDLIRVDLAAERLLEARRQLQVAQNRWPEDPGVFALAARLFLASNDPVGALTEIELGREIEPDHLELRLLQADIWLRETQAFDEAKRLYEEILADCPGHVEAERGLAAVELARAQALLQRGALEAAREAAAASMKIVETLSARRILAQIAESEGDLVTACEHLEVVLQSEPGDLMTRESLAGLYKKRGIEAMIAGNDTDKIAFFEKAISLRPRSLDLTTAKRIVAEARGEVVPKKEPEAPAGPTDAERAEGVARDLFLAARRSWEAKDFEAAEKRCRQSLELLPDNPLVLMFLGVVQRDAAKPEAAKESFERALEAAEELDLLSQHGDAFLHLAELALEASEVDAAREWLTRYEGLEERDARTESWADSIRKRLGEGRPEESESGDRDGD